MSGSAPAGVTGTDTLSVTDGRRQGRTQIGAGGATAAPVR